MSRDPIVILLPGYYEPSHTDAHRNLLAAILERAIRDYIVESADSGAENARRNARKWLCVNRTSPMPKGPWSFKWVCDHLDLDAIEIREKIVELNKRPTENFYRFLIGLPNATF